MAGILFILIISWILLYGLFRESLMSLGLFPPGQRFKEFAIGTIVASLLCFLSQWGEKLAYSMPWIFNEDFDISYLIQPIWWNFKSVLTEELLFRGALLIIAIRYLGVQKALIVSALSFGIYHWFSFGILGQAIPMIVVGIGTGLMGYAWALAFIRTKSIALATGLHLGWNLSLNIVFSKGPVGSGIVLLPNELISNPWYSLVPMLLIPLVFLAFVHFAVPLRKIET